MAAPYKTLFNFGNIEIFELQLLRQKKAPTKFYPFLESKKWYLLFTCKGTLC